MRQASEAAAAAACGAADQPPLMELLEELEGVGRVRGELSVPQSLAAPRKHQHGMHNYQAYCAVLRLGIIVSGIVQLAGSSIKHAT